MCGTGVIVTDSVTLSGMPVPGLEFGGSWEISPEDRAQVDRACFDWILLGISHNMDSSPSPLHLNCGRADWMSELFKTIVNRS